MQNSNCGIIEGYFGTPWSMKERLTYPRFLANYGYKFFIYAPKNDPFLRKCWDKAWDDTYISMMSNLEQSFHSEGIEFGIGFTPAGQASEVIANPSLLISRIKEITACLSLDYFVLLFDDLKNSDADKLAYYQLKITDLVLSHLPSIKHLIVCPSYYSTDPILSKVFGDMPQNYWKEYAAGLDPAVNIFWTGEKVCSDGYSEEHLLQVADIFKRKPFLWDNYPVNDGRKMADFLYLKPFANRGNHILSLTEGHAINPMREPYLNQLVLATLPYAYTNNPLTFASKDYWILAKDILGEDIVDQLRKDCEVFASCGRSSISFDDKNDLISVYSNIGSSASLEIVDYLNGKYEFDPNCLTG